MLGRTKLQAAQAWTPERQVREAMKAKGVTPRQAAKVAERVRGEQLGVRGDDVARLQAAEAKRARKAGRVLPEGHSGVPLPQQPTEQTIIRTTATSVPGVYEQTTTRFAADGTETSMTEQIDRRVLDEEKPEPAVGVCATMLIQEDGDG